MSNITITNIDTGNGIIEEGEFQDELLTFAGAGTVVAGTILARDSISLKLVPYVKGGAVNENGIPKKILTYDVTATGAGDVGVRAMTGGTYSFERTVINADGDNTNVDAEVIDEVLQYAKTQILKEQELNILDNQ